MRFCAKFHLQMCAVLSQFGLHIEAIENANKAAILSEDNILKTFQLYSIVENKEKIIENSKEAKNTEKLMKKDFFKNNDNTDENSESYIEKMIHDEKIVECQLIVKNISSIIQKNREFQKKHESLDNLEKEINNSTTIFSTREEY